MTSFRFAFFLIFLLQNAAGRLIGNEPPLDDFEDMRLVHDYHHNPNYDPTHPHSSVKRNIAGFKYFYVASGGRVYDYKVTTEPVLKVIGSDTCSVKAHRISAYVVAQETKHMPLNFFYDLARQASVGIFTWPKGLATFPEYYQLADSPACSGKCTGSCSTTCTFDGRKWSTVAGAGGVLAAVLADNVLCNDKDPYRKTYSVLAHELAHTIHRFLPTEERTAIQACYVAAKSAATWKLSAYAMATVHEYWAEATTAYFGIGMPHSSGGMISCGKTSGRCTNEKTNRKWLIEKDPKLYKILKKVYTNNDDGIMFNMANCMNDNKLKINAEATQTAATEEPSSCKNEGVDTDCDYWKQKEYCSGSIYTPHMTKYCAKACNICKTKKVKCKDGSEHCAYWTSKGFCDKSSKHYSYMKGKCPKSCKLEC